MKHIRTCQQQVSLQSSTDTKGPRSSNPLLFITTDYSHLRLTMTVTFTVITPLTKQILKSMMMIPSQMVIVSSVVIMILLSNIILYANIQKTKRTFFAIILHNNPMQGIDFR
jgi:hypothetical protein